MRQKKLIKSSLFKLPIALAIGSFHFFPNYSHHPFLEKTSIFGAYSLSHKSEGV